MGVYAVTKQMQLVMGTQILVVNTYEARDGAAGGDQGVLASACVCVQLGREIYMQFKQDSSARDEYKRSSS